MEFKCSKYHHFRRIFRNYLFHLLWSVTLLSTISYANVHVTMKVGVPMLVEIPSSQTAHLIIFSHFQKHYYQCKMRMLSKNDWNLSLKWSDESIGIPIHLDKQTNSAIFDLRHTHTDSLTLLMEIVNNNPNRIEIVCITLDKIEEVNEKKQSLQLGKKEKPQSVPNSSQSLVLSKISGAPTGAIVVTDFLEQSSHKTISAIHIYDSKTIILQTKEGAFIPVSSLDIVGIPTNLKLENLVGFIQASSWVIKRFNNGDYKVEAYGRLKGGMGPLVFAAPLVWPTIGPAVTSAIATGGMYIAAGGALISSALAGQHLGQGLGSVVRHDANTNIGNTVPIIHTAFTPIATTTVPRVEVGPMSVPKNALINPGVQFQRTPIPKTITPVVPAPIVATPKVLNAPNPVHMPVSPPVIGNQGSNENYQIVPVASTALTLSSSTLPTQYLATPSLPLSSLKVEQVLQQTQFIPPIVAAVPHLKSKLEAGFKEAAMAYQVGYDIGTLKKVMLKYMAEVGFHSSAWQASIQAIPEVKEHRIQSKHFTDFANAVVVEVMNELNRKGVEASNAYNALEVQFKSIGHRAMQSTTTPAMIAMQLHNLKALSELVLTLQKQLNTPDVTSLLNQINGMEGACLNQLNAALFPAANHTLKEKLMHLKSPWMLAQFPCSMQHNAQVYGDHLASIHGLVCSSVNACVSNLQHQAQAGSLTESSFHQTLNQLVPGITTSEVKPLYTAALIENGATVAESFIPNSQSNKPFIENPALLAVRTLVEQGLVFSNPLYKTLDKQYKSIGATALAHATRPKMVVIQLNNLKHLSEQVKAIEIQVGAEVTNILNQINSMEMALLNLLNSNLYPPANTVKEQLIGLASPPLLQLYPGDSKASPQVYGAHLASVYSIVESKVNNWLHNVQKEAQDGTLTLAKFSAYIRLLSLSATEEQINVLYETFVPQAVFHTPSPIANVADEQAHGPSTTEFPIDSLPQDIHRPNAPNPDNVPKPEPYVTPSHQPSNTPYVTPVPNIDGTYPGFGESEVNVPNVMNDTSYDGTKSSAVEQLPNLSGKTKEQTANILKELGFSEIGKTQGGYEKWYHSDGSKVYIRPNGEIVRTGPKIKSLNGETYRPRFGPDGKRTSEHNTGEEIVSE